MSGQSGPVEGSVSLGSLSIEQLESITDGMSKEVEMMQKQMAVLMDGIQRLQASRDHSVTVGSMNVGDEIMVPLTGSIYVPGSIADVNKVLVDVGTGYFVEKRPDQAAAFFSRRATVLKQEADKTSSLLSEKRQRLEAVVAVLEKKKTLALQQQGVSKSNPVGQ